MKKLRLSCIEQGVLNPKYKGFRAFRVEIWDDKLKGYYGEINELTFLVPDDMFDVLYEALDGKEVDSRTVLGKPINNK